MQTSYAPLNHCAPLVHFSFTAQVIICEDKWFNRENTLNDKSCKFQQNFSNEHRSRMCGCMLSKLCPTFATNFVLMMACLWNNDNEKQCNALDSAHH